MSPVPDFLVRVGETARQRREALGLSLADLSRLSGLSRSALSRIERGQSPDVGCGVLLTLADALGMPFDALLGHADSVGVTPAEMKVVLTLRQNFTEQGQ